MSRVRSNGAWLTEEQDIRLGVGDAFKVLLSKYRAWKPSFEGNNFSNIELEVAVGLEQRFSEEEILKALYVFCGDKAPSPDGFPMDF